MDGVCFIAACNDERVLRSCLLASPDFGAGVQVSVQCDACTAAQAYNQGIANTQAEVMVFLHQDVFLSAGWLAGLHSALAWLEKADPHWGVLGVYGVAADGRRLGWTYSTGLGQVLGHPFPTPQPVRTLDEMVLVIRRNSGLRFDEGLPGFHMYGTDICLEAEQRGLRNYVIPCFALHNSNGLRYLPGAFWRACRHVWRSRQERLPVQSPCVVLTESRLGLARQEFRHWLRASRFFPRRIGTRVADPAALHQQLVAAGRIPSPIVHEASRT